ncbi:MAG: InlB B-repeat-containing protein [Desulfocapsaceae bacterium]|nr:InlB B-repeat-containing protein [Desulfocapsaceae bacterium]
MKQDNVFRHIFGWLLLFVLCLGAGPVYAATISGTVYNSGGVTPITTSGYVDVYTSTVGPCDAATYTYVDTAFIEVDGTYTTILTDLPVGDYYLKAFSYGNHVPEWWADPASSTVCGAAQIVAVTDVNQTFTATNFQLDPGATISGTMNDSNGSPILVGGVIEVYASDPCSGINYVTTGLVNINGSYVITGLSAGSYYLKAVSNGNHIPEWYAGATSTSDCLVAQAVVVTAGQTVGGNNFQLDIGAIISGTVTDNGSHIVGGGLVEAYSSYDCVTDTYTLVGVGSIGLGDGTYAITGLPAGNYLVKVYPSGNYNSEWWASPASTPFCTSAQTVTAVVGGTAPGINFQLAAGATISGTVYDSSGTTTITGGGSVIAYKDASCTGTRAGIGFIATNGTYTISGLLAGNYYLKAFPAGNYLSEWWASPTTPTSTPLCGSAAVVSVATLSITTGMDFQLDSAFLVTTSAIPVAGGIITGGGTYLSGDPAILEATPATGYTFANWSSATTTITNPLDNPQNITVIADTTIIANFDRIPYLVTTSVLPAAGGTVTGGNITYLYGDTAILTATPARGYVFTGWSGDITATTNPLGFPVYSARSITANFVLKKHISFPVRAADGTIVIIHM